MVPTTKGELRAMPWKDLQGLAKKLGVKANVKKDVLQELCWVMICDAMSTTTSETQEDRSADQNMPDACQFPEHSPNGGSQTKEKSKSFRDMITNLKIRVTGSAGRKNKQVNTSPALSDRTNQAQLPILNMEDLMVKQMQKLELTNDTCEASDKPRSHPLTSEMRTSYNSGSPAESAMIPSSSYDNPIFSHNNSTASSTRHSQHSSPASSVSFAVSPVTFGTLSSAAAPSLKPLQIQPQLSEEVDEGASADGGNDFKFAPFQPPRSGASPRCGKGSPARRHVRSPRFGTPTRENAGSPRSGRPLCSPRPAASPLRRSTAIAGSRHPATPTRSTTPTRCATPTRTATPPRCSTPTRSPKPAASPRCAPALSPRTTIPCRSPKSPCSPCPSPSNRTIPTASSPPPNPSPKGPFRSSLVAMSLGSNIPGPRFTSARDLGLTPQRVPVDKQKTHLIRTMGALPSAAPKISTSAADAQKLQNRPQFSTTAVRSSVSALQQHKLATAPAAPLSPKPRKKEIAAAPASPIRPTTLQFAQEGARKLTHTPAKGPRRVAVGQLDEAATRRIEAYIDAEMFIPPPGVGWKDITGRDELKKRLSHLALGTEGKQFEKLPRCPTRNLLLFGLPGTGKTLLAQALAGEINASVYIITADALLGAKDPPEMVLRTVFKVAAARKGMSLIVLDDLYDLLKGDGPKDKLYKIRTELLVQLDLDDDGPSTPPTSPHVLVLGITSHPEGLGTELLQLFGCKMYVPLPDEDTREMLVFNQMAYEHAALSVQDMQRLVRRTSGYSCVDIIQLCRAAKQEACVEVAQNTPPDTVPPNDSVSITSVHFHDAIKVCGGPMSSPQMQMDMELFFWSNSKI